MSKEANAEASKQEAINRAKEAPVVSETVTAFHQPLVDWLNDQKGKPLTEHQWMLVNKVRYFANKYHAHHKQLSVAFKDV